MAFSFSKLVYYPVVAGSLLFSGLKTQAQNKTDDSLAAKVHNDMRRNDSLILLQHNFLAHKITPVKIKDAIAKIPFIKIKAGFMALQQMAQDKSVNPVRLAQFSDSLKKDKLKDDADLLDTNVAYSAINSWNFLDSFSLDRKIREARKQGKKEMIFAMRSLQNGASFDYLQVSRPELENLMGGCREMEKGLDITIGYSYSPLNPHLLAATLAKKEMEVIFSGLTFHYFSPPSAMIGVCHEVGHLVYNQYHADNPSQQKSVLLDPKHPSESFSDIFAAFVCGKEAAYKGLLDLHSSQVAIQHDLMHYYNGKLTDSTDLNKQEDTHPPDDKRLLTILRLDNDFYSKPRNAQEIKRDLPVFLQKLGSH